MANSTNSVARAPMTFIFKLSRVRKNKDNVWQVRGSEYTSKNNDTKACLSTCHLDHNFISGLHYCAINSKGELKFSEDQARDQKTDLKINFSRTIGLTLIKQIETMEAENPGCLTNPTLDERTGHYKLYKYQLVVRTNTTKCKVNQKETNAKTGRAGGLEIIFNEDQVDSIELVKSGHIDFISRGVEVDVDLLFQGMQKSEVQTSAPTTVEATMELIASLKQKPNASGGRKLRERVSVSENVQTVESVELVEVAPTITTTAKAAKIATIEVESSVEDEYYSIDVD